MRLRDFGIFGPDRRDGEGAGLRRKKRLHDSDRAARVGNIDRLALGIIWMNLDRGMDPARRRAANQERQIETFALHLGGDKAHLVERWRDETRKADRVHLFRSRGGENL